VDVAPVFGPGVRGRVLGALLKMVGGFDPAEAAAFPVPLDEDEAAALELASDEDLALANACLEVEYEIRRNEIAAMESVLALLPHVGSGEGLDVRLRGLPPQQFARAVSGLYGAYLAYGDSEDDGAE
jgi:hypothetical protein